MAMLRNDGDYTIYVLKHRNDKGEWVLSSLDNFGFAGAVWTDSKGWNSPRRDFSASGDCWQRTGIMGCFDRSVGLMGLSAISEDNPTYEFGLFELTVCQHSRPIATMALLA
jgi:hypothetical protein